MDTPTLAANSSTDERSKEGNARFVTSRLSAALQYWSVSAPE